jgi:hypothetical protein
MRRIPAQLAAFERGERRFQRLHERQAGCGPLAPWLDSGRIMSMVGINHASSGEAIIFAKIIDK